MKPIAKMSSKPRAWFLLACAAFLCIFLLAQTHDRWNRSITPMKEIVNTLQEKPRRSLSAIIPKPLQNRRLLVAKLWAMSSGGQLGNQVYELLSFIAVARNLSRVPVIVLGDPFNYNAEPQFMNLLVHFPKVLEQVEMYYDTEFHSQKLNEIHLGPCAFCYYDFKKMEKPFIRDVVLSLYADFLQNYRYLDMLGYEEVVKLLSFPRHASLLAREMMNLDFLESKNRLCVHTRRSDFITNNHQYSTANSTTNGILRITRELEPTFSVALFGDDRPFLEGIRDSPELRGLGGRIFLERTRDGDTSRFTTPAHFTWLFMKENCNHILLTASTSTFGFLGAYLAGNKATVYYYKGVNFDGQTGYDYPVNWKLIS